MSGNFITVVKPTFGFIPLQGVVLNRLPKVVPLLVQEGITGDQYLPFTPETPDRTLTNKYRAIPPSEVRYEYSKPFVWVTFPQYLKHHAHEGEKYAELSDIFWQMLEMRGQHQGGKDDHVPKLNFYFSPKFNQKLSQLVSTKMQLYSSTQKHYQSEINEFIEAANHFYQSKHGVPLPDVNKKAVEAICHLAQFGPNELQKIFALTDIPPRSVDKLMQYLQLKMQGRILMDSVFPGQNPEKALLRKNRLYAFEQVRADFDFGIKTLWERVTLGIQGAMWAIAKPFVAKKEHWKDVL